jgi:hypothetical protein
MIFSEQLFDDFQIQVLPCALPYRCLRPLETERFELPKYGLSHPSYAAGLVDIIDSNQPGPVTVQCISKTADSRDQRTKVKGPRW